MATILTKKSDTASAVPAAGSLTNSTGGAELAVNTADKRLFAKNSGGTVVEIGTNPTVIQVDNININGNAITSTDTNGNIDLTPNGTGEVNITKVDIDSGAIDGTAIGASSASTGAFTTLSATGNVTLGDASTDTVTVNGYMGVGGSVNASRSINIESSALTGTTQRGLHSNITGSSAATSAVIGVSSFPKTAAAVFTVADAIAFQAGNVDKGAGSTITNQHGLYIADQTGGTNNYGITSQVSSGTNKWNIYASGTAANYFAGNVGIGTNSIGTGVTAHVSGVARISNSSGGVLQLEDTTVADNSLPFWVLQSDEGVFRLLSANRSGTGTTGSTTRFSTSITESVFNDTGADIDFRVESDTNTHAFFVQGSDGNVGIGTSSPGNTLDVRTDDATTNAVTRSLALSHTTSGTAANGIGSGIIFQQESSTGSLRASAYIDSIFTNATDASLASALTFTTRSGGSLTERMRIDSSGNVGIGTSSPGERLTVVGGGSTSSTLNVTGGSANDNATIASDYSLVFQIDANNNVGGREFNWRYGGKGYSDGTLLMTLKSSGNLGLGVTPSAWSSTLIKAIQIGDNNGSISSYTTGNTSADWLFLNNNAYYDATGWKYTASSTAAQYAITANEHRWFTAPSGTAGNAITFTQAMTLDASGNLGIGTSSPALLTTSATTLHVNTATAGKPVGIYLTNADTGSTANDGTTLVVAATSGDFQVIQREAANVTVFTSGTERARIDSSGNLLVGTTSATLTGNQVGTTSKIAVEGSVGRVQIADTGNDIAFSRNSANYISATAGTSANITVRAGSAVGGVILSNGATSWASASDERYKTDLVEITSASAKVATLRAVTGRYKTDEKGVSRAFLIAQDVQTVLPEAVTVTQNADNEEDNGKLMLSYTDTIPLLVAAIKELKAELDIVKAELSTLKGN